MPNIRLDLKGKQFGCLQVVGYDRSSFGSNDSRWEYRCVNCGHEGVARGYSIKKCPKSCVNCKMLHREYPLVETSCTQCGKTILTGSNHPIRLCSDRCRLEQAADRMRQRRATSMVKFLAALESSVKCRARRKGVEFDLEKGALLKLYEEQGGLCARTGVRLKASAGPGNSRSNKHTASVDRVDPTKGYTTGNVELVSYLCNTAKNAYTHEDLYDFCKSYIHLYEQDKSA